MALFILLIHPERLTILEMTSFRLATVGGMDNDIGYE